VAIFLSSLLSSLLAAGADLDLARVQDFLLGGHRHGFVLVKGCAAEPVLRKLLLHVHCVLRQQLKVLILQTFRDLKKNQQALLPYFSIVVLQEVNDVFRYTKVETRLDLVRVACLED